MTRTIAIAAGLFAVAAFALIGWPANLFVDHDFVQYWLAGRALLFGQDPYDPTLWRALHADVGGNGSEIAPGAGFLYPAVTAVAVLPFAVLPFALAAAAWFVALIASAVLGLAALARRLFTARPRWDLAVLLLFAAVIRPDYLLPIDGNITGFLVAIVGVSLALLLDRRAFGAGAVLGLAVVKPHLFLVYVPALVLFADARDRLRLLAGGATTAAVLLAVSLALRPSWIGEWTRQSLRIGSYARTNLWGVVPADAAWLASLLACALVALLLVWWRVTRPALPTASAAALAISVLLAPYAFMIDQAVLLVGVAAFVSQVQGLAPAPRNLLLLLLVATASPWYMAALIGVVPINVLRLIPPVALLSLTIGVQAILARAPRRAARVAPA
jgi:alpha-1,2-mannosyltransferase